MKSFPMIQLAAACGLLAAGEQWTVDAILNIPTLSDPQIRPDGCLRLHSQEPGGSVCTPPSGSPPSLRDLANGCRWLSSSLVASMPYGSPGSIPKFALTMKDGRIFECCDPLPLTGHRRFAGLPTARAIAYLAADSGPEPTRSWRIATIVTRASIHSTLNGGEPRRSDYRRSPCGLVRLLSDGTRAVYAAQPTPRNRDSFDADLYEIDLRNAGRKPLVTQPGRDADPPIRLTANGSPSILKAERSTISPARHVALIRSVRWRERSATRLEIPSFDNRMFPRWAIPFRGLPDGRTPLYLTGGHLCGITWSGRTSPIRVESNV